MLKLLIVDDDLIFRNSIRKIIDWEKFGFEICGEAEDGLSALKAIQKLAPDLVLIDLYKNDFSGLEVIRKIRELSAAALKKDEKKIHFLIVSDCTEFRYAKKAISLEVDGYLVKPVNENELIERISAVAVKIGKKPEDTFFYSDKKYSCVKGLRNNGNPETDLDITEEAKKLGSYIQVVDNKKIQSFFDELGNYYFNSNKPPQEIRQECMELMIEARGDVQKKIPQLKEMPLSYKETLNAIMYNNCLELIINAMLESCLDIGEALPQLSADSNFQRIISYIKNNFNENLSLETLSQLFYYNSAYLGKRFKKITGKSFHVYLDVLRIDMAKELLQNTSMKVYEISNAVGYVNTDYFFNKFKKYTGKSPLLFRKTAKSPVFT